MVLQKLYTRRASGHGFTLVELAIVLAVAALLFAGLWRLLSAGNTQLRDQAAADQQKQLQSAVQAYLASPEGQSFITNNMGAPFPATANLPLPAPGGCPLAAPLAQFCNFLPAGFTSATTNSYGQTYAVQVLKDGGGAGTAAQTYSFMILTNGVTAIPDTSGGRIASLIGNDGGFLYSTPVCSAVGAVATTACGAFGSWTATTTSYGFAASTSGHLASRTAVSVGVLAADPWLARRGNIGGAPVGAAPGTPQFNTLQTDTFLMNPPAGGTTNDLFLGNNTVYGGSDRATRAGTIDRLHFLTVGLPFDATGGVNGRSDARPTINVLSPCTMVNQADPNCQPAINVTGDVVVSQLLVANRLFAGSFIYSALSDVRMKHGIRPIDHALDDLSKIKAVAFRMNQNDEEKLGVIAQEVEKVYPQLVSNIGGDYKGVDYVGLIGPLIGAVNELRKQNESLRDEVREQAAAIKRLEKAAN